MSNRPEEERDGETEAYYGDRKYVKRTQTKTGDDGVIEIHVDYKDYKKKSYSYPKQTKKS